MQHGGGGQILLAREVLVQAGFCNTDSGGHFVDRHRIEAFLGQQAIDGMDDRVFTNLEHARLERDSGGKASGHELSLASATAARAVALPRA